MADIATLVARAHAYASRSKLSPSTVSRKILGNGKRLAELEAGKSLNVHTLDRAFEILDRLDQGEAA